MSQALNRTLPLAIALGAGLLSSHGFAQKSEWTIDPNHSSANFEILHMGVSHVHGAIEGIKGTVMLDEKDITKSSVTATLDATTVSTGVARRDADIKGPDYFNVEKNPTIAFKSTSLVKSGGKLQMIGDLTLNGVTKSITLDLDGPTAPVTMNGKTLSGFSASGRLTRKDFDFGEKAPANGMIGEDIKFTIDVEIDKKP
jgi:polyisoprenoid-binding protein YceI